MAEHCCIRRWTEPESIGVVLQLGSNDALEGKFALLEGGFSGIEDDFQQMKKNMASSGRLPQKSTEPQPTTIYWS